MGALFIHIQVNRMKNKIEMRTSVAYTFTLSQNIRALFSLFSFELYLTQFYSVCASIVCRSKHTDTHLSDGHCAVRCGSVQFDQIQRRESRNGFLFRCSSSPFEGERKHRKKNNIMTKRERKREKEQQAPINIMKRGKVKALSNRYDRIDRTKEREIENPGCRIKNNLWLVMLMMRFQFFTPMHFRCELVFFRIA